MKLEFKFDDEDLEPVSQGLGDNLLVLNKPLVVRGVRYRLEAWRMDDADPLVPVASLEARARRFSDGNELDDLAPLTTIETRGHRYGILIYRIWMVSHSSHTSYFPTAKLGEMAESSADSRGSARWEPATTRRRV